MATAIQNLPVEMTAEKRFIPVGKGKADVPTGWNKPENQMDAPTALKLSTSGQIGVDVSGHGSRADYLFVDFDNVLDDAGEFVNADARQWFEFFAATRTFGEASISGHGLHFFFKPTPNKFAPVNKGERGILYLDADNPKCKIELYYRTAAKYCLLTGVCVLGCEPQAQIIDGEEADRAFQTILDEIQRRLPKKSRAEKAAIPTDAPSSPSPDDDAPTYEIFLARAILKKLATIDHTQLTYEKWLAVNTACKSIGVPYPYVDEFNAAPGNGGNYDANANLKSWEGLPTDPKKFNINTLRGIVKPFGFDEEDVKNQWYTLHPELIFDADEQFFYFSGDLSDLNNARRLERFCADKLKWVADAESWLTWQKCGCWLKTNDKNHNALPAVFQFVDKVKATLPRVDDEKTKKARAVLAQFKAFKKISPALTLLKGLSSIRITAADLDAYPNLLCVQNGVVELETGKLFDADPQLLLTRQCSAAYDPTAQSPLVDKFFSDIMPNDETCAGLLRWLGYCLTGDVREERFMVWLGASGANGKGSLSRTLAELLCGYAATLPQDALVVHKFDTANGHTASLNPLIGARFAISEELAQNSVVNSALIKTLVGGDMLTFRALRQEAQTHAPTAKINIASNFTPKFENIDDGGLERRALVMPYTQTFKGDRADPHLKKKLLLPENLRALLALLVGEAVAWYRNGLIVSDEMTTATRDSLAENDWLADFLDEFCELGTGELPRRKLLDEIRAKCIQAHRFSDREICKMIERRGVGYRKKGTFVFTGIRLCSDTNRDFGGEPLETDDIPPGI